MCQTQQIKKNYYYDGLKHIHYRIAGDANSKSPLVCFHMSPYSGDQFAFLQKELSTERLVLCPDTPGYGNSDAPSTPPKIEDYVERLMSLCDGLGLDKFNVMGFHTGSVIALEMGRSFPDRIKKIIPIGIPLMEAAQQKELSEKYSVERGYFSEEEFLSNRWQHGLDNRGGQSNERFLSYFSDSLSAGAEKGNWGFAAVFKFALREGLVAINQPVLIPLPNESLKMNSLEASKLLLNAQTIDWSHMSSDLFEVNYKEIADAFNIFLDN